MPELDLRGKVCPNPTVEVFEALKVLPQGEALIVISDYAPARSTIPAIADQFNCSCEMQENGNHEYSLIIRHTAD